MGLLIKTFIEIVIIMGIIDLFITLMSHIFGEQLEDFNIDIKQNH